MIHILRKYNKKILAVLGVFLMISFLADLGFRRYNRMPGDGASPGKFGKQAISAAEYQYAYQAWQMLRGRDLGFPQQAGVGPNGQPQYTLIPVMDIQLAGRLAPAIPTPYREMALQYALSTAKQILQQLDAMGFLLLLKEAERMNIRISNDEVQRIAGRVSELPTEDPAFRERVIHDWLMVFEAYTRMTDAVKVTPAMGVYLVAQEEQEVGVKLVEFKAADFKTKVAPPTTQPVDQFFQKYKDTDAEANEFGIGYRYPNRIKLEYVRIPLPKLREKVTDEDTYEFWKRNQQLFPTTQPAETQPAETQPSAAATNPSTKPVAAASTQPTTRPWTEVKDQIRNRIANDFASAMAKNTLQSFNADWAMYRQGVAAGQASNVVTSLGVPFDGQVYVKTLTERIQTMKDSRSVLPETVKEGEWLTKQELGDLPRIGKSIIRGADGRSSGSFADFAFERATPFMTDAQKKQAMENQVQVLAPFQPSLPFRDPDGSYYIFRMIAADPAHAATTMAGLETRVRNDWITLQAYELAKEAARKFLETAKGNGLDAAAKSAGDLPIIDTGLFFNDPRFPISKYTLSPQAKAKFIEGAFLLLQDRLKTGNQHPVSVIDLPKAMASVVTQLADAKPAIEHSYFPQRVADMQRMIAGRRALTIAAAWFNPEAIQKRLDYKASENTGRPAPGRNGPQAPPPLGF